MTLSPDATRAGSTAAASVGGRNALIASVAGYGIDGFDLLILSFLLPGISAAFALAPPQAGSLVTATLLGAVAGGILFGLLSDRFGRVRILMWTILLFSLATGLSGLARDYDQLFAARLLFNLGRGVGGVEPVVVGALATAYSQGTAIAILSGIYLVALFATLVLLPETRGRRLASLLRKDQRNCC